MYNKFEIEFLLFHLRDELEHVNRAIVDLERKARSAHPRTVRLGERPSRRGPQNAGRDWTHHRLRAS
jgi:hypothetical protein